MARQRESSHLLVSISLESSVVFITDTNSLAYVWSPSFSYSAPPRARRLQRWDISHGAEEYHNVLIDSSAALLLFRELPLSAPMSYLNIKSPLCKCSKNLSQFIKKKKKKLILLVMQLIIIWQSKRKTCQMLFCALRCHGGKAIGGRPVQATGPGCLFNNDDKWRATSECNVFLFPHEIS